MIKAISYLEEGINCTIIKKRWRNLIARCNKLGNQYEIMINEGWIENITSTIKEREVVEQTLLLHEIAHINEGSFEVSIGLKDIDNKLVKTLYNLLEDARVEYRMQLKYPNTADYFKILIEIANKEPVAESLKLENEYTKFFNAIYKFIRMDIIDEELIDLMTFLLPIKNRLSYCNSKECLELSTWLYEYMMYYNKDIYKEKEKKKKLNEQLCEKDRRLENMMSRDNTIGEIISRLEEVEEKENSNKKQNSEIEASILTNKANIIDMKSSFKLMFESLSFNNTYEGELNLAKQQQAYMCSITNDDEENYFEIKKKYNIEFDFVLVRDVSVSIKSNRKEYYDSTISILTSLEDFKNVKTSCIYFSDDCNVEKTIQEDLISSEIKDIILNGTNMLSVFPVLQKLEHKSKKRFILILTDGETEYKEQCQEKINDLKKESDNVIIILHIGDGRVSSLVDKSCEFSELSSVLYSLIHEYVTNNMVGARYE